MRNEQSRFVPVIISYAADELASPPATNTENNRLAVKLAGFAVCSELSNDRRKVINAGARHDDAVAAAMSFLSDTQEFTAVVLPEFRHRNACAQSAVLSPR